MAQPKKDVYNAMLFLKEKKKKILYLDTVAFKLTSASTVPSYPYFLYFLYVNVKPLYSVKHINTPVGDLRDCPAEKYVNEQNHIQTRAALLFPCKTKTFSASR